VPEPRLGQAEPDLVAAAVAGRAAGLAALHLSHLDMAVKLLRSAVACARRAGDGQLEGEVVMSLAYALTRRGEPRRALRTIDAALAKVSGLAALRARAQSLGVAGSARNLLDGGVEAVFEGADDAVASMVEWCRRGPRGARVDDVAVKEEEPRGEQGFSVG
jgi:acylphosphatase